MKLLRLVPAALLTATLMTGLGLAGRAQAQGFSDNTAGYSFNPLSRQPGQTNNKGFAKHIFNFTHVDGGKNYIDSFLTIDYLRSGSSVDPANKSKEGASEVYAIYRGDLSLSKLTGTPVRIGGIIRDISLQFGGDVNTENRAFGSAKKLLVIGPNFHFDVSKGFVNFAVHLAKEWGHNGIIGKSTEFNPTAKFNLVFMQPLPVGIPLSISGIAVVGLPKGKDAFGVNSTATELFTQARLTLDAGAVMFGKPHVLDTFVGVQYWLNKFGNDHKKNASAIEFTPFFGAAVHF